MSRWRLRHTAGSRARRVRHVTWPWCSRRRDPPGGPCDWQADGGRRMRGTETGRWSRSSCSCHAGRRGVRTCTSACILSTAYLHTTGRTVSRRVTGDIGRRVKVKYKVNSVSQFSINLALHRYGKLTCHMGSHSVTCHPAEVRIPSLPPAEAGTRLSDPGGMQGWVDLCYVKADRPGIEPATCKSQVQRPTTEPPRITSGRNIGMCGYMSVPLTYVLV